MKRHTHVSIQDESFLINNNLTYKNKVWNGHQIEGLLFNSRMVQGVFDDLNPDTVSQWAYPDTGIWDANRNTDEFIAAIPLWKDHGLLAFTLNLQGGSPYGYSDAQPWINSALHGDGTLNSAYIARLERILDRADELGMVVILGIFYFGQEKVLDNDNAILHAVDNVIDWLFDHNYSNVLIEINNECNIRYKQPLLMPDRVHELIVRAKERTRDGQRFLVSTSYGGNSIPGENVIEVADFILLHGNGVENPDRIRQMIHETRAIPGYQAMPVIFNEDDHFNFDKEQNNFVAAISEYASWGYFDYRMENEGFEHGYQSMPVDWGISSNRKRDFFNLVKDISSTE